MCHIYASQDPSRYACETRAIRLHGHVTSIRLERSFWDVLERIAAEEGSTVPRFCATLHDEVLALRDDIGNFASLLRVTCLTWLENRRLRVEDVTAEAA